MKDAFEIIGTFLIVCLMMAFWVALILAVPLAALKYLLFS